MKSKLKAFTLLELLVSMIITGIVISMALYAFITAFKQLDGYRQRSNKIRDAFTAFSIIGNDIEKAVTIRGDEGEIELSNGAREGITYEFDEKYFTRTTGEAIDTFFIGGNNVRLQYVEPDGAEERLIADIKFESSILEQSLSFHYHKNYRSDVLMDLQNEN